MYNLKYNTEKTLNAVQTTLKLIGSDSIWYVHVTLPFGDTFDTFEVVFFLALSEKPNKLQLLHFMIHVQLPYLCIVASHPQWLAPWWPPSAQTTLPRELVACHTTKHIKNNALFIFLIWIKLFSKYFHFYFMKQNRNNLF